VLTAAVAFAVILIGLIWLAVPPVSYAASIGEVNGQVEFRSSDKEDWQSVAAGQKVMPGAEIYTSAHSQATLIFPDGGRMQLDESTFVVLDGLTHRNKKWQIALLQNAGQTDSQVDPQTSLYQLRTPAGQIDAKGTHFGVRVETDGTTVVDVHEGSVTVPTDAGESSIEAGQSALFMHNSMAVTLTPSTGNGIPTIASLPSLSGSGTQTNQPDDMLTQTPTPTQTGDTDEENHNTPPSSEGDGQHP
jgi:hypothetical protein